MSGAELLLIAAIGLSVYGATAVVHGVKKIGHVIVHVVHHEKK